MRDLTYQPRRFHLLDVELVAFRGADGEPVVFRDLCIHRGAALSLGWVQDGVIAYAEINPDYTRRPEPSDVFPVLDQLKPSNAS